MKKRLKRAGVVVAISLVVLVGGYFLLDRLFNKCGKVDVVNKPSFKCLPSTVWDDSLATEGRLIRDEKAIQEHFQAAPLRHLKSNPNIAYREFPLDPAIEKGAIVISNGRTESMLIYDELIRDLNGHGYSVYIHDHRGQGLSKRLIEGEENSQKSHVTSFDDYVADLKQFVDEVVKPAKIHARNKPVFLVAHSMGGAVASLYLENEHYHGDFDKAVLVTPMHAAQIPWWAVPGATFLQAIRPEGYALGRSGYCPASFIDRESDLTHSRTRFERIREIYKSAAKAACDAKAANKNSDLESPLLGGPTHGWIHAASEAGKKVVKHANQVTIPVLILQASDDTAVSNKEQKDFCDQVPKGNCRGFLLPKSFHAIFNEADTYRVPAMTKIFDFLEHGHGADAVPCDPWMEVKEKNAVEREGC